MLDGYRAQLAAAGVDRAVLSSPETIAALTGFVNPVEDWPVAHPFARVPPLLVVGPREAALLVADVQRTYAPGGAVPVAAYRSYDHERAPDIQTEWAQAFDAMLPVLGGPPQHVGVEALTLPALVADRLRARGYELVDIASRTSVSAALPADDLVARVRRASALADRVQQAVKELAAPGLTELDVAAGALAAMYRDAGRRVPAIVSLTAGPESANVGADPSPRVLGEGDLVLTDTSPWIDGVWSDSANAVVVGRPTAEHLRVFDAVRRTLELAIGLCRPGAHAGEIDRRVRAELSAFGPTYPHHTGHGIGTAWSEPPRITPDSTAVIDEGMVLAVEPAVYVPGWGGIRLEHVFLVTATGQELLTEFEHTL